MIFDLLSGKKTYIVALAGIIWGIYTKDPSTVVVALGMMTLRNGISSEVKKLAQPTTQSAPEQPQPELPVEVQTPTDPQEVITPPVFG